MLKKIKKIDVLEPFCSHYLDKVEYMVFDNMHTQTLFNRVPFLSIEELANYLGFCDELDPVRNAYEKNHGWILDSSENTQFCFRTDIFDRDRYADKIIAEDHEYIYVKEDPNEYRP